MRIVNITLENYRIHDKLFVEFEKGINLLLGSNGKGKSSILEAIGITLFSSSFRDGNTKGQQQCIKYGKKEALIVIEFIGNDNETYIIENQIKKSGGYNKLYNKNSPDEILSAKDEILDKLSILVGIDGEVKDIYENIIVAKQNEFINSFKLKGTERQKVFDRIFNTDIYRDIYEGFSKKSYDNYINALNKETSFIEGIEKNLEDYTLLLSQYNEKEKESENLNSSIELFSKELKTTENLLENHRVLDKKITSEKREIDTTKEIILIKKEELRKLTEKLEKSKESEKILNDNSDYYHKYNILRDEYKIKSIELDNLSKKVDYFISQQLLQGETTNNIEKRNSQIKNIETKIINLDENLKIQLEEKNSLDKELLSKEAEKIEFENSIKKLNLEITQFDKLKESYNLLQNQIEIKKAFLESTNKSLEAKINDLNEIDIIKLKAKLKSLNEEQLNKNELILQVNALDTRINDNNHAKVELSSSLCPYLKEKCLNLHNRDTSDFFNNKEQILINERNQILDKISKLSNVEKEIKTLEQEINSYEKVKQTIENEKNQYSEDNLKYELLKKDFEIENLKLLNFSKEVGSGEDLNRLLTENRVKLENLFLENLKEKSNIISIKIAEIEKNKNELLVSKTREEQQLNSLKQALTDINTYLNNSQTLQKTYEQEKEKLKEIDLKSINYQPHYEIYIKNEPHVKELPNIIKGIALIEKEIFSLIERENLSSKNLISLENEKNSYKPFDELLIKSSDYKSKLEEAYLLLGTVRSSLIALKDRMDIAKSTEELIRDKKMTINVLKDKVKLTEIFRKNIKDMGIRVSQTLLQELSFWATENFRKITGRNETISWSNEDSPYEVCLVGDKRISFEQLSGGEQVAVAISIRGAMTSTFTKTNFSIFDEPTNNLDLERRKSLADNIGEILSNLEQSIIVTHDDSFREMAQKVIEI